MWLMPEDATRFPPADVHGDAMRGKASPIVCTAFVSAIATFSGCLANLGVTSSKEWHDEKIGFQFNPDGTLNIEWAENVTTLPVSDYGLSVKSEGVELTYFESSRGGDVMGWGGSNVDNPLIPEKTYLLLSLGWWRYAKATVIFCQQDGLPFEVEAVKSNGARFRSAREYEPKISYAFSSGIMCPERDEAEPYNGPAFFFVHGACSSPEELWITKGAPGYTIYASLANGAWHSLNGIKPPVGVASIVPDANSTPDEQVEQLANQFTHWLDSSNLGAESQVIVVGHSNGGLLTRKLLDRDEGDRLFRLVTLDAPDRGLDATAAYSLDWFGCEATRTDPAENWDKYIKRFLSKDSPESSWLQSLPIHLKNNDSVVRALYVECNEENCRAPGPGHGGLGQGQASWDQSVLLATAICSAQEQGSVCSDTIPSSSPRSWKDPACKAVGSGAFAGATAWTPGLYHSQGTKIHGGDILTLVADGPDAWNEDPEDSTSTWLCNGSLG